MSASEAGIPVDRPVVLLIDDDAEIRGLFGRYLRTHGFEVIEAPDAMQSRRLVVERRVDLVLLDLGLPDEDGLSVLRHLRGSWQGPVIVVTGRGDAVERVVGLELGADDYVTKPFDFRELVARIRTVLRRSSVQATGRDGGSPAKLSFAGFVLDPAARTLFAPDGREVNLTSGEFAVLQALVASPRHVLSRDQLMSCVHGRGAGPYDRAIDMQIGRLRRKLADDAAHPALIKSVRGAGYLLAVDVTRT